MRTQLINYSGYELEALPQNMTVAELLEKAHKDHDSLEKNKEKQLQKEKSELEGKCFIIRFTPKCKCILLISEVVPDTYSNNIRGLKISCVQHENGNWELREYLLRDGDTWANHHSNDITEVSPDRYFELQTTLNGICTSL